MITTEPSPKKKEKGKALLLMFVMIIVTLSSLEGSCFLKWNHRIKLPYDNNGTLHIYVPVPVPMESSNDDNAKTQIHACTKCNLFLSKFLNGPFIWQSQ